VTSGAEFGTIGGRRRHVFLMLWCALSVFYLINTTINAISQTTELTRMRVHFDPIEPYVWEYSSAVFTIALVPFVAWMLKLARPGRTLRGWLRFLAVHTPATGVYCLVHVGGFWGLRKLVYLAFGGHYTGTLDFAYEYPKDLRGYALVLALTWAAGQFAQMWKRTDAAKARRFGPVLDIYDGGSRLIRAPVTDIVATRSAGNYVEFHLADGRKPLMRTTLAGVEEQLKPHGFLRTHRSWLVNPLRVRGMTAAGSGDWTIELDSGVEALLSRRFPQALSALRSSELVV
jgi:hypothetical protein